MNSSKLFLGLILSFLLISSASALTVYAGFNDETQTATVEDGSSVDFQVDFFSMNPPMSLVIELKDSSDNLIYTILDNTVSSNEFNGVYTLNKTMYSTAGSYSIIARGRDRVGSSQYDELRVIVRDTINPAITISSPTNGATYSTNLSSLTFTATDLNLVKCEYSKDNGITKTTVACTSGVSKTVAIDSQEGANKWTVYATDTAGNVGTKTVDFTVNSSIPPVDSISPLISILGPTDGTTYNAQVKFLNFIATDSNLKKCEYSTDNGVTKTTVACTSGVLTTVALNSVEGANKWIVYAEDNAGNTHSNYTEFTVDTSLPPIPDTTAPVITVITPVNNKEYSSKKLTFKVTTDEDATLKFSLDGEDKITMSNPYDHVYTYTISLSDDNHEVTFYATDAAGNVGTKTVEFSVDYKTESPKKKEKDTPSSEEVIDSNTLTEEELTSYSKDISTPVVLSRKSSVKKVSFFEKIIQAIVDFFNWLFGCK